MANWARSTNLGPGTGRFLYHGNSRRLHDVRLGICARLGLPDRARRLAGGWLYMVGSVVLSVAALFAGLWLVRALA